MYKGKEKVEDLSSLGNACAGFFAAFFSSLTLCPTELIKCKLQAMREMQSQMDIANKVMVMKNNPYTFSYTAYVVMHY